MSRIHQWLIAGVAVAALAVSLGACRNGGLDSAPATGLSSRSPTGAVSGALAGSSDTAGAGGASAAPSAALAQVSADLSAINAGGSQADTDIGAGDSDRTKSDDPN